MVSLAVSLVRNSPESRSKWTLGVLRSLGLDSLRYAAFLGCFSGSFVGVDEAIAAIWGKSRTARWRALAAGLCAGPSLLLTGARSSHNSLAIYVLVRALVLLVRLGNRAHVHPWVRALLSPSRWQHGDVALMCIAVAQILYSFLLRPDTLPSSYIRFLGKHAGKPQYVYQGMRELCARNDQDPSASGPLECLRGTPLEGRGVRTTCDLLGPGHSCDRHFLGFLPTAWARALPVYLPVYLLPAILVHRQATQPRRRAGRIVAPR